jgi:hypothetical protein
MRVMAEAAKLRRAEHAQYGQLDALLEQLRVATGKPINYHW